MGDGFTSTLHHKVDAKGRVSVPAGFRRELEAEEGEQVHLRLLPDSQKQKCLEGYQLSYLRDLQERIKRMRPGSPERRFAERKINASLITLPVDEAGRVVISPKLRETYGISEKVVFVGLGQTFQLWAEEEWERAEAEYAAQEAAMEAEHGASVLELLPWSDAPEAGGRA